MEFVDTWKIIEKQKQIIRNANNKVFIFSPYLQISSDIEKLLIDKHEMHEKKEIFIITGKKALQSSELKKLTKIIAKSKNKIEHFYNQNLHAKIILSDNEALISSMNLFDFSRNNFEAGIYLSEADKDSKIFCDLKKFCDDIRNNTDKYQTPTIKYNDEFLHARNHILTYKNYIWLDKLKSKLKKDSLQDVTNTVIDKARILFEQTADDTDEEIKENEIFS